MNNNNNLDIDKLFFSVWRNIFLKSNILLHLRLYMENHTVKIYSMQQLEQYKCRSYITRLNIQPNQKLEPDGIIPSQVEELSFSLKFNQVIKVGQIPSKVKRIYFNNLYFDQPIEKNVLPQDLEYLKINGESLDMDFGVNRALPDGLRELEIYSFYQRIPANSMPLNLKILKIHLERDLLNQFLISRGSLPNSLEVLHFEGFNQELDESILPRSITDLKLRDFTFQLKPNDLPPNLKRLTLVTYRKQLEESVLPKSLEYLEFYEFDSPIKVGDLPGNLQVLKLGKSFNQSLQVDTLPSSLQSLHLSNDFNQPILPNVLPNSLKSLYLGHWFSQTLEIGSIPQGLQLIKFGYYYSEMINPGVLPSSLTLIHFRNSDTEQYITQDSIPIGAQVVYDDEADDEENLDGDDDDNSIYDEDF